jgi:glycosyltransferase involved in cell wall biosynthesis
MRVLQVIHQFLPKYLGGTEVYAADLTRRLLSHGHDAALFTGGDTAGPTEWEGVPATVTPGGLRGPRNPAQLFLTAFGNRQAEAGFGAALADFRPDVVHLHHLLGLSTRLPQLARAAGVPVCATLHDYWFLCPKSQLIDHRGALCEGPRGGVNCAQCAAQRLGAPWLEPAAPLLGPLFLLRQARVRRAFAACDALLAPSDFLLATARRAGLPAPKLLRVDFGLDIEPALPRMPRPAGAPLRVVYLGALDESKGVHLLLEACRLLNPQQVEIAIYGSLDAASPAYLHRLRALAAATPYGPAVLRGAVPHAEIPALLGRTDALTVPSLWYENAPLVIAEAFVAGTPVVASNQGALAEQVHDGADGLLFGRGDAAALAAALQRLADEPGLLERLQAGIGQHASRAAHYDHMERVYRALMERAPLPQR